jgi:type III restriction enzyme
MGKYNPDWAITFREGSVKHIYFVAETKGEGNLDSLSFTSHTGDIEKAKIECARRHFAAISSNTVKYSAISSYSELLKVVNS